MTLGHDNHGAGPGWHVASVRVEAPTVGRVYSATLNAWFAADEGDGKIERDIAFAPENVVFMEKKSPWVCTVKTGDVRGAGTNAKVTDKQKAQSKKTTKNTTEDLQCSRRSVVLGPAGMADGVQRQTPLGADSVEHEIGQL